jgi:hypothetical protein
MEAFVTSIEPIRRRLGWLVALCLGACSFAHAESTASVIQTAPTAQATLGRNETFWVRIQYTTDAPISLWARPYLGGVPVKQAHSNPSLTYQGHGTALGWFSLIQPGAVNEVRILAGGGHPYREWELARYPVHLAWTSEAVARARPQWVEDLLAAEQAQRATAARQRANEPVSAGDVAFMNGFMLIVLGLVVGGIGVPLWSVWKWRGGWRVAAAVPAAVMAFVVLRILIDTARDPTSHNLWPFEILMWGVFALAWIGVLTLGRRFAAVS